MTKPTVFISSSSKGLATAWELKRQIAPFAEAILWSEGAFYPGKTATESLSEMADRSDFAVFVLGGDDRSGPGSLVHSPRQNVVFELGFLAGRLGLSRTFVVVDADANALPSDLAGTMYIALDTRNLPNLELAVSPAVDAIRKAILGSNPRSHRSVEYYSCFISYSWKDKDFAAILHDDLQAVGVRCWLDAREMRTGDPLKGQIDRAIQAHDKVLLVLSQASVQSAWVRIELRNALRLEHERRKTVLFPVRLDDSPLEAEDSAEFDELRKKYIIDFSDWREKKKYRRAFSQLARDLAISVSVETERPL